MSAPARTDSRALRLLDERTAALARRSLAQARDTAQASYLVCAVGGERYGLPLAEVAAVLPQKPCAALPGAPAALRGIVALSGRIVTVIDLAAALGAPAVTAFAQHQADGHLVRLRRQEPPVALAVDRVLGVVRIAAGSDGAATTAPEASLGAEAVSGYAAAVSEPDAEAGFAVLDLSRLMRRYLS